MEVPNTGFNQTVVLSNEEMQAAAARRGRSPEAQTRQGGSPQVLHATRPGGSPQVLHATRSGGSPQVLHATRPDGSPQVLHATTPGGSPQVLHEYECISDVRSYENIYPCYRWLPRPS